MYFNRFYTLYIAAAACLFQMRLVSSQEEFQTLALNLHNQARVIHHVNPLALNDLLNQLATLCAQYYAGRGGVLDHSCPYRSNAGENLYAMPGVARTPDQDVTQSINLWYNEGANHNFSGDWDPNAGHFTQMVWAGTQLMGYGLGRANGVTVGVALYYPMGNIMTQFAQNVFPA